MAVKTFLNPFGAYIDGLERGSDYAFKQATNEQTVRDNEDNYITKLLRRPDEMTVLGNQAKAGTLNNYFGERTLDDRTNQVKVDAAKSQLRYDIEKYLKPLIFRTLKTILSCVKLKQTLPLSHSHLNWQTRSLETPALSSKLIAVKLWKIRIA